MTDESSSDHMASLGEVRLSQLIASNGGVHSTKSVARLLNKHSNAVIEMARDRLLIAFPWKGTLAFPAAQFEDEELISGVREVLAAFSDEMNETTIALFFLSSYETTGKKPLELLKNGMDFDILKTSARTHLEHNAD